MDDPSGTVEQPSMPLYPLEFHVTGTPVSLQATPGSKDRWKRKVGESARQRAEQMVDFVWLEAIPLAVTIFYFPLAPMAGDIDNIVKPILDAMKGKVYPDDKLIERVVAQKFEPDTGWLFSSPTAQLAKALDAISAPEGPQSVVYIRIDDDLRWRTQP